MTEKHADSSSQRQQASLLTVRRLWPIAILLAGIALFFVFDLSRFLTFEALRDNRTALLTLIEEYGASMLLAFAGLYILIVAFSLPGGAFLTIASGFLFGPLIGASCVVIAATIGATILFLIAKTTLGDALRQRAGPWLQKMEAGFQENAFSYLLVLRLIPVFPFFVVNLVPAFLGVTLRTYFLATLIGIIPGTLVYSQVGAGLGSIFDSGESFTVSGILTTDIILALAGLALLSLVPVLYKKLRSKQRQSI